MSTTTQRKLNYSSVKTIMNSRINVPQEAVGKRVVLTVQGNGNVVDVTDKAGNPVESLQEPGSVLRKKIFNCSARSGVACSNSRNIQMLKDAVKAEKAGEADKAHELYNDFLNKTQLSFGVLLPSSIADKLSAGVEIAAKVEMITTDNGSILTLDPKTISVIEPERLQKSEFDMDKLLGAEETATEPEVSAETVDAVLATQEL